ncbi:acetolactate decarboxylase, partial [Bacillus sp. WP8]|uniref:acetolactate decarboxylase n=1 Tax=Bacillus sp. WP8 TaxID=756828 RepID=UPI0037BF0EED
MNQHNDTTHHDKHHHLYQLSTITSFLQPLYHPHFSLPHIPQHPHFPIPTFNQLHRHLIPFHPPFYPLPSHPTPTPLTHQHYSPFSSLPFFQTHILHPIHPPMTSKQLQQQIHPILPTKNIFYPLPIHASFKNVQTPTVQK